MKKILVSGCLFGWDCRYDAKEVPCADPRFLRWKAEGRLVPICPEIWGGLPTPRPDSQRAGARVVACTGADMTAPYEKGAAEAARMAEADGVAFAIMKEDSPSCGSHFIYDGTFTDTKVPGMGLASERLSRAGFTVLSEAQLDEAERLLAQAEAAGE